MGILWWINPGSWFHFRLYMNSSSKQLSSKQILPCSVKVLFSFQFTFWYTYKPGCRLHISNFRKRIKKITRLFIYCILSVSSYVLFCNPIVDLCSPRFLKLFIFCLWILDAFWLVFCLFLVLDRNSIVWCVLKQMRKKDKEIAENYKTEISVWMSSFKI